MTLNTIIIHILLQFNLYNYFVYTFVASNNNVNIIPSESILPVAIPIPYSPLDIILDNDPIDDRTNSVIRICTFIIAICFNNCWSFFVYFILFINFII